MKIVLTILVLLGTFCAEGADFYSVCMSKTRPAGIDDIINGNLGEMGQKVKFGNKAECTRFTKIAEILKVATADTELKPLRTLEIFPRLESLTVTSIGTFDHLDIGKHPHLTSFSAGGKLKLSDLGDLINSALLQHLAFGGADENSSIDLSQISRLPHIHSLTLVRVKVKNAKAIETLKELQTIGIKESQLDEPIDWSALPMLEYKKIE